MPRDDELGFTEVIAACAEAIHTAMHQAINFSDADSAHMPGMQAGFGAGLLFGLHMACQYPKIAAQIERRVFLSHPELSGPHRAADIVAGALVENVLGVPATLAGKPLEERLMRLSVTSEGTTTTDTPYWPLPTRPHPYKGYEPGGEGI